MVLHLFFPASERLLKKQMVTATDGQTHQKGEDELLDPVASLRRDFLQNGAKNPHFDELFLGPGLEDKPEDGGEEEEESHHHESHRHGLVVAAAPVRAG